MPKPREPNPHVFPGKQNFIPGTIDGRTDVRIWAEAVRKERAFQWRAAPPEQLAAERGGNDLQNIRHLRHRIGNMAGDFLWHVHTDPDVGITPCSPTLTLKIELLETRCLPQPPPHASTWLERLPTKRAWPARPVVLHRRPHRATRRRV